MLSLPVVVGQIVEDAPQSIRKKLTKLKKRRQGKTRVYEFCCWSRARSMQARYNEEDARNGSNIRWTITPVDSDKSGKRDTWAVVFKDVISPEKNLFHATKLRNFGPYKYQSMTNHRAKYNKEDKTSENKKPWKGLIVDEDKKLWKLVPK